MRPLGEGLDGLLPPAAWPGVPVLIMGPRGSGRRTWADHVMAEHGAKWVWRSEEPPALDPDAADYAEQVQARRDAERVMHERGLTQLPLSKADAVRIGHEFFRLKSRVQRWVSVGLDGASAEAQNALLKALEELASTERIVLRGRPGEVLPTIRSRCMTVWLRAGAASDEVDLVETAGDLSRDDAQVLCEMRPGRPGAALRLAGILPARSRADSILSAAEARDSEAIATSLSEFDPEVRVWVAEWCAQAAAGRATSHTEMARQAGRDRLMRAEMAAKRTHNPRLAVRAASMLLVARPNVWA